MVDPIIVILDRYDNHGAQNAGPEIIEELEDALVTIYGTLRWDSKFNHWDGDYEKTNPNWFHRAAAIAFPDEIHFDILRLFVLLSPKHPDEVCYKVSTVTMQRMAQAGLLHSFIWQYLPIPKMLIQFELDRNDTRWMPTEDEGHEEFIDLCFNSSRPENERIALVRYFGQRIWRSGRFADFIPAFVEHAFLACAFRSISKPMMQAVIDVWARYQRLTDADMIYRELGHYFSKTLFDMVHYDIDCIAPLVRWMDTSPLIMCAHGKKIPHRPEMIAEWPIFRGRNVNLANNIETEVKWIRKWQTERAYRVLAMMILLGGQDANGELRVSDAPVGAGSYTRRRQEMANSAKRFFRVAAKLPMELQEILASVVVVLDGVIVTRLRKVPKYTWRWALKQ